jgi:hypothetical protein
LDLVGFGWIWLDLVGFGWIWLDLAGFGWIWLDLAGFGWIWLDSGWIQVGFGLRRLDQATGERGGKLSRIPVGKIRRNRACRNSLGIGETGIQNRTVLHNNEHLSTKN